MKKIALALFVILLTSTWNFVFSQYTDAQLKTAFIYNFALNITWPNENELDTFTIAVPEIDSALVNNFKILAKTKKIKNLPIKVITFKDYRQILKKNVQIIYLNAELSQDIKMIYYDILQSPILLVTDNAIQNIYVMINFKISTITKKLTFEVNLKNIEDQKLKTSSSLVLLGGSELDQKQLLKEKEQELQKEKELVKKQQELLEKQNRKIDSQLIAIRKQEEIIRKNQLTFDSLMRQIKKQQEYLAQQNAQLEKLQYNIKVQENLLNQKNLELKQQQDSVEKQRALLLSQKELIREKMAHLEVLNNEIAKKEKALQEQKLMIEGLEDTLQMQKIFMGLMGVIILLVIFIIVIIYKNFKEKKRFSEELMQKNNEIEQQAEELQQINIELVNQKEQIQKQNEYITDSISYAKKILSSLLPELETITYFADYFLIYYPKDIVSGDFYWYGEYENYKFFAVGDCTGHGVPGALLSILGSRLLNEIIIDKGIYNLDHILSLLNINFKKILKQETYVSNLSEKTNDGMDLVIIRIDFKNNYEINFAGAKRPLIYYNSKEKQLTRISGSHFSIGGFSVKEPIYKVEKFYANAGDIFILMSDGYIDQNNKERKRFGTLKFIELIRYHIEKPLSEIKQILEEELKTWQNNEIQRDDITVLGIKLK